MSKSEVSNSKGNIVVYIILGVLIFFVLAKYVGPKFGIKLFGGKDDSIEYSHAEGFPKNLSTSLQESPKIREVINDQQKLKEVIASIDKNNEIKIPEINFDRKTVLFVASKVRNTGGYETRIKKITQDKDDLVVEVREFEPGDTCISTQQLNIPTDLVVMDKTNLSIEFKIVTEVKNCN